MLRGQESSYDNLKGFGSANGSSSYLPQLVVEYYDPTVTSATVTVVVPAEPVAFPDDAPSLGNWIPILGEGWKYGHVEVEP